MERGYHDNFLVSAVDGAAMRLYLEEECTIREYNYYQTKDMNQQERIDYYNTRGIEVHKEIQARKLREM